MRMGTRMMTRAMTRMRRRRRRRKPILFPGETCAHKCFRGKVRQRTPAEKKTVLRQRPARHISQNNLLISDAGLEISLRTYMCGNLRSPNVAWWT